MKPIKDRKLPERSKLTFHFPKPEQGGGSFVVTLPFFENIKISENKRARYQKYDLISRSSQLYTYLGADSRKFTLEFTMSFPHILEEHGGSELQFIDFVEKEDPWAQKKQFFSAADGSFGFTGRRISNKAQKLREEFAKLFIEGQVITSDELNTILGGLEKIVDGGLATVQTIRENTPLLSLFPGGGGIATVDTTSQHSKIIDLVMYWTNMVRSSVLNNADNPIYGPPIVRINHGILFQNIPCICTNYSIEPVEEAGYDVATLMPRRIRYTMSLEEVRAGDFGKFDPSTRIEQDNICGWEAVVSSPHQSVDPGPIL